MSDSEKKQRKMELEQFKKDLLNRTRKVAGILNLYDKRGFGAIVEFERNMFNFFEPKINVFDIQSNAETVEVVKEKIKKHKNAQEKEIQPVE